MQHNIQQTIAIYAVDFPPRQMISTSMRSLALNSLCLTSTGYIAFALQLNIKDTHTHTILVYSVNKEKRHTQKNRRMQTTHSIQIKYLAGRDNDMHFARIQSKNICFLNCQLGKIFVCGFRDIINPDLMFQIYC